MILACTHSLVSFRLSGLTNQQTLFLTENCLRKVPEMKFIQGKWSIFYACLCAKERIGPPSANQGLSTATHSSSHVHSTPFLNPLASPYPILSASEKPIIKVNMHQVMSSRNQLKSLVLAWDNTVNCFIVIITNVISPLCSRSVECILLHWLIHFLHQIIGFEFISGSLQLFWLSKEP